MSLKDNEFLVFIYFVK